MNKEINVQYAYKKDGKGERHGDQAERLLAAQARKHNVQMPTQQLPPQLFAPQGPAAGVPQMPPASVMPANSPAGFRGPPPQQPNGMGMVHDRPPAGFHAVPTPPPMSRGPPQGFPPQTQLAPPPQGLPPRPPPPVGFQQGGYQQQMPGMVPSGFGPPPGGPPAGFPSRPPLPAGFQSMGAPPPGFPPAGMAPQGFPGASATPPAGFSGQRR